MTYGTYKWWAACGVLAVIAGACSTMPSRRPAPVVLEPAPVEPVPVPPPPPFPVMLGVDVLASQRFAAIAGKRVALLTHDAARNRSGEPTWSVLYRAPEVDLVALLVAEHGLDGKAPASAIIRGDTHSRTGLPVYSLYGDTRRPTSRLLKQFDTLVIDLQDIGTRSYTFISAMREALEACVLAGVEVVVLDRPNPLGGVKVSGPGVDEEWRSYVGSFPVPYVHGLTIGELARLALRSENVLELDEDQRASARVVIVPMRGWKRAMRWADTGLRWQPTSPYIQDVDTVEGYPMTGLGCILGGWTHGVGRDRPFRGLAFRGKPADQLVKELSALDIPGLGFRKVEVAGANGKKLHGTVVDITDWDAVRLTGLSFHMMRLACVWSGGNPFRSASKVEEQIFNRHVGSSAWWRALRRDGARVDVRAFVDAWEAEAE
ncbi:MAG: DUF1343 domain-containing protein, partial [Opitutaceae bacterium]